MLEKGCNVEKNKLEKRIWRSHWLYNRCSLPHRFFSQIVGIYMYARCGHTLNDAVMNIGRSLVTEESIDDAQAKAKKGLEKYMGDTQIMPLNEMSISVDYASGSKKEWTKGNFITVSIVAHIKSNCFITPKVTTVSSMVMIEH